MSEFVLPTGTVTLLLADIEGSVRLWESGSEAMTQAMSRFDALVSELIEGHGGVRPKDQGEGDGFLAAFARPSEALASALALQLAIVKEDWQGAEIRLRIALHTGEVELRDETNYLGSSINRTARLRDLAHGGQIILSAATYDLVAERMPEGAVVKDLGIHRLRDLSRPERVFQLIHPDLPGDFPALRSLGALPNNLPEQLTSFVGREKEIEEITRLLRQTRMLTLTGSGGCGKTRLALQVAAELVDGYEGGVWLAELAALRDPALVPATVMSSLGLSEERERDALETLVRHVASAKTLIVLDNCEHLTIACAELVEALLKKCPALTIVATSREALGLAAETTWLVPPLALPGKQELTSLEALTHYDAVRLFIERATKSRPNFSVTNENAPAVAEVCHRLDGIPLAIELAAARVRVLTPQQISDGLTDRFHLLTGGSRTAMPRQQTLQASVEWSYDLLSEAERLLLARLAVFAGGFTLDAAEAVASGDPIESAHVLDLLSQLVDKSLVLRDNSDGPAARYHLLETIRQYAMDRLLEGPQAPEVRTKHMEYFGDQGEAGIGGPGYTYNDVLIPELDNYRAAARWALTQADDETKLHVTSVCTKLLALTGHAREARSLIEEALASAETTSPKTRAAALIVHILAATWSEGADILLARGEEALQLAEEAGDSELADQARMLIGEAALQLGDDERLRAITSEIEESGRLEHICHAIGLQGANLYQQARLENARPLLERSLELARTLPNAWVLSALLQAIGATDFERGEFELARRSLQEAADVAASAPWQDPRTACFTAELAHYRGEYEEARRLCAQGIEEASPEQNILFGTFGRSIMARILAAQGEGTIAVEFIEEASALALSVGMDQADAVLAVASVPAYRAAGMAERARESLKLFVDSAPRPGQHFALASAMLDGAKLERDEGDREKAESLVFEALSILDGSGARRLIVEALEMVAGLAVMDESMEEAVRLFAAAQSARDEMGYVRFPVDRPRYESDLQKAREGLDTRFERVWAEGAAMTLDEAFAYASRRRGARKRPTTGWASLTPAELRVAGLVAEGLSNPKIAERLFISRHTVETHLKSIFAKLGFASRTQLASEATRRAVQISES